MVALPGRRSLGDFVRVSREGREWHSFAVATTGSEGAGRYCLVIRRAGDWTQRLASDVEHGHAPARLWVRRMRGYGFMYHAQAYRRVLIVATGAGIGPVLPYLLGRSPVRFECFWIGRCHRAAMGADLVDRVLAGGSVTLIDTSRGGRTWERASPGWRTGSMPCSWSATTWCVTASPELARPWTCCGTARPSTHRLSVPASARLVLPAQGDHGTGEDVEPSRASCARWNGPPGLRMTGPHIPVHSGSSGVELHPGVEVTLRPAADLDSLRQLTG